MGHHHQGGAAVRIQAKQNVYHLPRRARVEIASQFIGEQNGWFADKGAGDGDPLLLPSRELVRIMRHSLRQPDLHKLLFRQFPRPVVPRQLQGQHDILQSGQSRQELKGLKHETRAPLAQLRPAVLIQARQLHAVEENRAAGGQIQTRQYA